MVENEKICLYCGVSFTTHKSNKKYCSDLCGVKFRNRKYRQTPHGRKVTNKIQLRSHHKNREKRLESMREYHKTDGYKRAREKYNKKRNLGISFKGEWIVLGFEPRTGICSLQGIIDHPIFYTTVMHHYRYDENEPLAHTFELCVNCHLNTVHANGLDRLTLDDLMEELKW